MNKETLDNIIREEYNNITGIIVEKSNSRVIESYYNGFDDNSSIHVASVTKSILSILVGIAIDKKFIRDVDQRVVEFFPDYTPKRGEKTLQTITMKHLLTMTAPYKYKSEPYTRVYSSENWVTEVLHLLGGRKDPGTFKYTTIGIHVLSGILTAATGQTPLDFARKHLFSPLGMDVKEGLELKTRDEHLNFLRHSTVSGWVVDPQGNNTAGWGLTLKTSDMIKIGKLYLQQGYWNNKEIISNSWIEESTQIHSAWGDLSYGYLWWIIDKNSYAAIGDGGNIIYINPTKELVVAITSSFYPRAKGRVEFIKEHIEKQ